MMANSKWCVLLCYFCQCRMFGTLSRSIENSWRLLEWNWTLKTHSSYYNYTIFGEIQARGENVHCIQHCAHCCNNRGKSIHILAYGIPQGYIHTTWTIERIISWVISMDSIHVNCKTAQPSIRMLFKRSFYGNDLCQQCRVHMPHQLIREYAS